MPLLPTGRPVPTGLRRPAFALREVPTDLPGAHLYDVVDCAGAVLGSVRVGPFGVHAQLLRADPELESSLAAALESWLEDAWGVYGVNLTVSTSPSRIT